MLEVQVDMPNVEAWRRRLESIESARFFSPAQRGLLAQIGSLVTSKARARVPKAFGTLESAIDWQINGSEVSVGVLRDRSGPSGRTSTRDYGYYTERGAAPHSPPPGALRAWMARVGYTGSEYLLAKSIARRGLAPKPFLAPALKTSERQILDLSRKAYQLALDKMAQRPGAGLMERVRFFFRGRG